MKSYHVIGLMSGTSLDGLDIAYVEFYVDKYWNFNLKFCETKGYKSELKNNLKHAINYNGRELKLLDREFGKWIGSVVKKFMNKHHITPDLIVSHGHTIYHQPEKGITLQIGDGYEIMNATGILTICDLRSLDISKGGQGAPLVPIGDKYLFSEYELCLNLGGFSNISFDSSDQRIAFDICPVNTVLNYLSLKKNQEFDIDGALARSGRLNQSLLQKLNSLTYYARHPPKSLGIEWVEEHIFPLLNDESIENLLNTFCHHIAQQIISSVDQFSSFKLSNKKPTMLLTGGGVKNSFLVDLIKKKSEGRLDIFVPDNRTIDFKESIIFAFLGLLRKLGKVNTLKSVTGAACNSSGGLIYDHFTSSEPIASN